jgi:drug/metabolite transporter (DMT)-like permease
MMIWAMSSGDMTVSVDYLLPGLASVVLNFAANLGFVYSVKLSPLSRTIPLLSLTPAYTSLMAIALLNEVPSPTQVVGIALVVGGALLLNFDQTGERRVGAYLESLFKEKGSALMAGVALLWSLTVPLDKMAIAASSAPFHGLAVSSGVAVGAFLTVLGRGSRRELRTFERAPRLILALIVCASLALAFQLLAIQVLLVSLVETAKRAVGCFMSVVLGRWVFGESVTLHKIITVGTIMVGVSLILGA